MKRVLITGASSGIGYALCLLYQQRGWQVIACARDAQKMQSLVQLENLQILLFDICDQQQVSKCLTNIANLDTVILNAGSCEYIDDAKNFDNHLFRRVINTNLLATSDCLAALLPQMSAGSQIALVGSSASYLPFSRAQAYGASKAGITYLAKSLAIDLKEQHIDISLVCPGFVKTPLTDKNNFAMPMLITAEQAAVRIFEGLAKRKKEIHFPKRFTYLLKAFSLLPDFVWHNIATRIAK